MCFAFGAKIYKQEHLIGNETRDKQKEKPQPNQTEMCFLVIFIIERTLRCNRCVHLVHAKNGDDVVCIR